MLDFELAELYGYETKRFNEQVKNNIEKFDETFRFQLTDYEWKYLLSSKVLTANFKEGNGDKILMSKNLTSSLLEQKDSTEILKLKKSTSSLNDKKEPYIGLMFIR